MPLRWSIPPACLCFRSWQRSGPNRRWRRAAGARRARGWINVSPSPRQCADLDPVDPARAGLGRAGLGLGRAARALDPAHLELAGLARDPERADLDRLE